MKQYVLVSQGIELFRTFDKQEAEEYRDRENANWYDYRERCVENFEPCADNEVFMYEEEYDRQYVIVCNRHNAIFGGALLFGGHRTNDNENRSFGGYTSDFSNCELYTLEEIENKHYHFPIYNDTMDYKEFKAYDDIIIKVDDLKNIKELKTMTVVYRP